MATDDGYSYPDSLDSDYRHTEPVRRYDTYDPVRVKENRRNTARRYPRASETRRADEPIPDFVGSSAAAHAVREKIERYAAVDAPVLVVGETGVGKELVAKQLHALSARRAGPMIAVNAAAIPDTLASSELFGHKKGAFTGAVADRKGVFESAIGGSLFLDEIGDLPLDIQTHLLRVLETRQITPVGSCAPVNIDCRLICATNADLRKEAGAKRFRRDLLYRIDVLTIEIPPLRERGDDVIEIAGVIIEANIAAGYKPASLTPKAAEKLKNYYFPGNVRELRNVLTRALVHADDGRILPENIEFNTHGDHPNGRIKVSDAKKLVSKYLIVKALSISNGNVSKAATLTGGSRDAIYAVAKEIEGQNLAEVFGVLKAESNALFEEL
ncbi:MAG: sigma-54 dependent transcriptional regulator [Pseudomonadota bacterium]